MNNEKSMAIIKIILDALLVFIMYKVIGFELTIIVYLALIYTYIKNYEQLH